MTRSMVPCCFLMIVLLAGCGNPGLSTSDPGKPLPHGGTPVSLPGGKGFVEVVKKADVPREGNVVGEVQFFFLNEDFSPNEAKPTSGSLAVNKGTVITLLVKDGGLATPAGKPLFAGKDPDGLLTAEVDGKTLAVPLGLR